MQVKQILIESISNIFAEGDKDGNGKISKTEFKVSRLQV